MKYFTFLVFALLTFQVGWTVPSTSHFEDHTNSDAVEIEGVVSKTWTYKAMKAQQKEIAKKSKLEKRFAWFHKVMSRKLEKRQELGKPPIDFADPVEKWKWFAILFGGGGILLMIIGAAAIGSFTLSGAGIGAILWFIGWLAFMFGVASLVVWLIKINR